MLDLFPPVLNGTLREHYLLLFGSAGAFALAVGGFAAWLGARLGARHAARRALEQLQRDTQQLADVRHAALERSIEAIAIEIERISEAQRFSARLLNERAHVPMQPAHRRDPGSTTPH